MDLYLLIKTLHILSSTILFGTGLGTAFFMLRSRSATNLEVKYFAARTTVLADYVFTLPAIIIQPLTGFWLIHLVGYDWTEMWLVLTYILYIVAGLCWLPVVWIQIQLKAMLRASTESQSVLPERFERLFKTWFILGWPAFISLLCIFALMVSKPSWP